MLVAITNIALWLFQHPVIDRDNLVRPPRLRHGRPSASSPEPADAGRAGGGEQGHSRGDEPVTRP